MKRIREYALWAAGVVALILLTLLYWRMTHNHWLNIAIAVMLISAATYVLSLHLFQRSVRRVIVWIKAARRAEHVVPPSEPFLKPVTKEVEKLAARLRSVHETAKELSEAQQGTELWTSSRLKAQAFTHFGNRTLIVVSNREPYIHTKTNNHAAVTMPVSGLVTALDPVLRATSGLWIAHGAGDADRATADAEGKLLVPPSGPSYTLKRVWLTPEEEAGYYAGFANDALWPLCNFTHNRPNFREHDWHMYQQVNQKFADAILQECDKDRPLVLVQDYHFTLLPRLLKEQRPDAVVGLFWHIPWPTLEQYQICPWKGAILEGMLGADFVGFHLQSYANNFLTAVNALLPVRIDWDRQAVLHERGTTFAKPFPISVQPWQERFASEEALAQQEENYRATLGLGNNERIFLSVDRLDYAKGIAERIQAIEMFLERYPDYLGKVRFIQLGAPSRTEIPRYREFVARIEGMVDAVNRRFQTDAWRPILFLKANHPPETVYVFMRMAYGCIVSSLSDGMNLVAKEFVAARRENDGVLILSEFTGVAREFQEAVQINPYHISGFAEAIHAALEMPPEEQQRRMTRLRGQVSENNVYRWAADLLAEMARAAEAPPVELSTASAHP